MLTTAHRRPGRLEEPGLGREVLLHRAVVVEVVTAQIGEGRHVEDDGVDPVLGQGVGRDLHGHCLSGPRPGTRPAGAGGRGTRAWSAPRPRCRSPRWTARRGPGRPGPGGSPWSSRWCRSPRPCAGRATGGRGTPTPPRPWPAARPGRHSGLGHVEFEEVVAQQRRGAPASPPRRRAGGRRCGPRARSRTASPSRPGGCRTRWSGCRSTPHRRVPRPRRCRGSTWSSARGGGPGLRWVGGCRA